MFKLIRKIAASLHGAMQKSLLSPNRPEIRPEDMTNDKLLAALDPPYEYSYTLNELMAEANRRGMGECVRHARKFVDDKWDTWLQAECLYAISKWGNKTDLPQVWDIARDSRDYFALAAALNAIISLDPAQYREALALATAYRGFEPYDKTSESYVISCTLESIARNVSDAESGLEGLLIEWAAQTALIPVSRAAIFRRLANMPRTARIEQFFIDYYLANDLSYPELMQITNDALRSTPANNATA